MRATALLMLLAGAAHAQYTRLSAWNAQASFNPAAVSGADALFLNPAALMNAGVTGPWVRLMEFGGWSGVA